MSEDCREETVKAFVDMVAWAFGCQAMVPSVTPRLTVGKILLPVRHSSSVSRSPQDRQVARKGILEGPLLAIQCRAELKFREEGDRIGEGQTEICDLFREVGGMLLTAQERAREGFNEIRAGEGKWWTKVPRWGGAESASPPPVDDRKLSEKVGLANGNANKKLKTESLLPYKTNPVKQMPKRLSMADRWKIVQPGPSTWDRKLKYMQIGKDPASEFDDVSARSTSLLAVLTRKKIYMVSSVCHHIAVLRLRVHPKYLVWLADGASQALEQGSDNRPLPWQVLRLQRTRWYDLFRAEDRMEAMEGLWGIIGWLMRGER